MKIRGFTVGTVRLDSRTAANRYTVNGLIENTGLTRIFRKFAYRGAAWGIVNGAQLNPLVYRENADTGRRVSEVELSYDQGVPRVLRYISPKPAGPDAPDPESQSGTVDPLTAIYALLRDVPRSGACKLDVVIFDGRRRSRIFMGQAADAGAIPVCKGVYERLQGFTAKEVSRHTRFDFVLSYSDPGTGRLRVEKIVFDSFYGTAALVRR